MFMVELWTQLGGGGGGLLPSKRVVFGMSLGRKK